MGREKKDVSIKHSYTKWMKNNTIHGNDTIKNNFFF